MLNYIKPKLLFNLILLVGALYTSYSCANVYETMYPILLEASQGGAYVNPNQEELRQSEALFLQLFQGKQNNKLKQNWNKLGFEVEAFDETGERFLLIREKKDRKEGRGFYLFRMDLKGNTLQAPHSFHDRLTREIALKLFTEGSFSAASWNTLSRKKLDVVRHQDSFLMAFSRAFAKAYPSRTLIQLHGFSQSKRLSEAGKHANIIISSGTTYPSKAVQKIAHCMKKTVDHHVYISFIDIFELGGAKNTIGKMLQSLRHPGLIHLELSYGFRKALMDNPALLIQLMDCLEE
ncbi:hypothetical protein [Legionella impletisoli]|uniref:Lipoprotein n=1 Tax=Legionella impletisoli TaxID=343510 RepID=A0A917NCD8_9GAMM|nr:hypothetical protein [Legionella impletisoli]GGI88113.1 hypothetical protein GCM10007966_16070 [Legionella impletisoli]